MAYPHSGGIAKVLVVGNVATGKTSVIKRYVRNTFSKDYQTTIGVDFALKRVQTDGTDINVQLWDIAGQERFAGLSRIFYTHAVAAIIVFDLFDKASFQAAVNWKQDIDAKVFLPSGAPIPVLLLGNKVDLVEENQTPKVSDEEIQQMMKEHKFFAAYKCSAKSSENIKKACRHLVSQIVKNNELERKKAEEKEMEEGNEDDSNNTIKLDTPSGSSGGCC